MRIKAFAFDFELLIVPAFLTTCKIRKLNVYGVLDDAELGRNRVQGWVVMRILLNFVSQNPVDTLRFLYDCQLCQDDAVLRSYLLSYVIFP